MLRWPFHSVHHRGVDVLLEPSHLVRTGRREGWQLACSRPFSHFIPEKGSTWLAREQLVLWETRW